MKKVGAAAVLRSRTQNPGKAFIEWEKNEVEGGGVDPRFVVVVVVVPTIPPPTSPPDVDAFASRRPPPPPLPHEGGGDVPNKARFRIDHRALASRPRSIFPRADDRVVLRREHASDYVGARRPSLGKDYGPTSRSTYKRATAVNATE